MIEREQRTAVNVCRQPTHRLCRLYRPWHSVCRAARTTRATLCRLLGVLWLSLSLAGCELSSPLSSAANEPHTTDLFAMDTVMTLTAYGEQGEAALTVATEEITRLDELFSISSESGDLYRLNTEKTGTVSDDTIALLQRALELSESTEGVFDCTIAPVMNAWGFPTQTYRVPSQTELDALLPAVDYRQIQYADHTVTLPATVEIDFGGIAKGYTSDRVLEQFEEQGVTSGILSLGGNVQCLGRKPDGSPWRVAVQHPLDLANHFAIIEAEDEAVITSGGYERYFEKDGVRYHHILDPHTGYPVNNGMASVTIVSRDGTLADGLSTSLFIMGLDNALAYWQAHRDEFETVIMTTDERVYLTAGLADRCTLSEGLTAEIIH